MNNFYQISSSFYLYGKCSDTKFTSLELFWFGEYLPFCNYDFGMFRILKYLLNKFGTNDMWSDICRTLSTTLVVLFQNASYVGFP